MFLCHWRGIFSSDTKINEKTSYWCRKEVTGSSYVSISKLTGNNKGKLWKIGELISPKWLSFQTLCVWVVFWVRRSTQFRERLERTFWLSTHVALLINSCFICWLIALLFLFHYERTTKTKFMKLKSIKMGWKGWYCWRSQFGDVSCTKFQYHSFTWPKPNLKCHVGHTCTGMTHFD